MGLIGHIFSLAWKAFSFAITINIVIAIMKGGKETLRDLRDTLLMAIKVGIKKLQKWLFKKYQETEKET